MKQPLHLAALFLLAAFAAPAALRAQTVVGHVLDELTAAPVSAVAVMLLDSTDTGVAWAETDSAGRFVLQAPGTGLYRIYANRMAYTEKFSEGLPLWDAGSFELLVRMAPLPVPLHGLVVEAEAQRHRMQLEAEGFYRRQAWAPGYFFDAEEIEKWHPTFISDMLQRVPALQVVRRGGEVKVFSRRAPKIFSNEGCGPMKVVLDGSPVPSVGGDLDFLVAANSVIGMEIYASAGGVGAPVQHRGLDAFCGILMVWTR